MNLSKVIRAARNESLVITPRLNRWLLQGNTDLALDPAIAQLIYDMLTTDARDRSGSFSASSAGQCPRRQVLTYLGAEAQGGQIDAQLWNIFNDGKWRHLRWQAMLLQAGILREVEYALDWPKMRHMGHVDGVGEVPDDHPKWGGAEFGFELKGVSTFQFAKFKNDLTKIEHRRQVTRYFLMAGWDIFVIIYEDKTTQDWAEWVYEPEKRLMDEQRDELEALNLSVDNKMLPPILQPCAMRKGDIYHECPFGTNNACAKAKLWPRIGRKT